MVELLLYTQLNCTDTAAILRRVRTNENMSEYVRAEIAEVIRESTPHCEWDAND